MTVKLPNIRKLFVPDKGYTILDVDLSGADAQVVAWEATDSDLKSAFRAGLNVHNHNGKTMWGESYSPKAIRPGALYTMRDETKRAVHATNYGTSARTLAITLQWKIAEAERFKRQWFATHPGIRSWHQRIDHQLQTTKRIQNKFGYAITYFDRPDGLLPQALAWIPQSTVGIVCSRGACNVWRNLPYIQPLLQVHDSFVFQIPNHRFTEPNLLAIKRHLEIPVPYDDPLTIPWELSASAESWGHCEKLEWTGEAKAA